MNGCKPLPLGFTSALRIFHRFYQGHICASLEHHLHKEGHDEDSPRSFRPKSRNTASRKKMPRFPDEAEPDDPSAWHSLPRGPLWKGRRGSKEAALVVRELRRSKGDSTRLQELLKTKVHRLIKLDLITTLRELQQFNEVDLALMIFAVVRREHWYKPDAYLFRDMLNFLGRNKRADDCRNIIYDLKTQGVQPSVSLCSELMVEFLHHGMVTEAIEVFEEVKQAGNSNMLMYRILFRGLDELKEYDLWVKYRREYKEKFKNQLNQLYIKTGIRVW